MNKRAIIYARVSTEDQAKFGYGLDAQVKGCREYALKNGMEIAREIVEEISGAKPMFERPGGKELWELVARDEIGAVIIYTHDRIARDVGLLEYLLFKQHVYSHNAELHLVDQGLDPFTPMANFIGVANSMKAADERAKIRKRSMDGRREKALAGKWIGNKAPYGYRKIGMKGESRPEIDETEAPIVKRIFSEYSGISAPSKSLRKIIEGLTRDGIPSPQAGKGWHAETVKRLIQRRCYIGEFVYTGIVARFPDLALVDRSTWDAAQARRKRNKELAIRNQKYHYLLAGHLACICGASLCGTHTTSHHKEKQYFTFRYHCTQSRIPTRRLTSGCFEGPIPLEKIDSLVWEWVESILLDEQSLDAGIKEVIARTENDLEPRRARLVEVEKELERNEARIKRLINRLGDETDEIIVTTLSAEVKQNTKHREALTGERDRIKSELDQKEILPEAEGRIKETAALIRQGLASPDFETKRGVLDLLDFRGQVRTDEAGRWLDVTCGLKYDSLPLELCHVDMD